MFCFIKNQKGVTQIIVIASLVAILGMAAMVIDVGSALAARIQLSNAVDAAALAGAMELPTDRESALDEARSYLTANGVDISDVVITINESKTLINIRGAEDFNFMLAPVIGIDATTLHAEAEVIIGNASNVTGLRPFGIDNQELNFGDLVVLKEEGGDGTTGNFGGVAFELELVGASNFIQNILYGYDGEIEVGEIIYPEPGNMASAVSDVKTLIDGDPYSTYDDYAADSPRVWTIPVLEDMSSEGRSDEFTVVGFAAFFIEDIQTVAGKAEVTGRFIQVTANGEIDETAPDLGVYAMKLVK